LCDRLESGGWIKRQPSPTDRRVKEIVFEHKASLELEAALAIGDVVQAQALAGLDAAQRKQLMSLLRKVHGNLTSL